MRARQRPPSAPTPRPSSPGPAITVRFGWIRSPGPSCAPPWTPTWREQSVQDGRDHGGVRSGSNRRARVHLPSAQRGPLIAPVGANLDPVARMSVDAPTQWPNESLFTGYHRFAATTNIVKDAATPQPKARPDRFQDVSPPADFSPADSSVASKQKEDIPDESKPAAVPDLPAPLPELPPVH